MTNDLAVPVIAGLVIGVGLIVVFSMATKPTFSLSDDEILNKVRNLPDVKAFYERYTPLEQIGRNGTTTYVYYHIGITWPPPDNQSDGLQVTVVKELRLIVKLDQFGRTSLMYQCAGPITLEDVATVQLMRTTPCIEAS